MLTPVKMQKFELEKMRESCKKSPGCEYGCYWQYACDRYEKTDIQPSDLTDEDIAEIAAEITHKDTDVSEPEYNPFNKKRNELK